jgi:hypothetical protein
MDNQDKKYIKFFRLLWLIPVIVLGYIGWVNLLPFGGTITHTIDIGGDDTEGMAVLTGPFDRVSEPIYMDNLSYRELMHSLVYFELEDINLNKAGEVGVTVRFRDDFPADSRLLIGARNGPEWDYSWKEVYVSNIDNREPSSETAPGNNSEWLTAEASWQMNNLYIIDDTLRFSINVPHLTAESEMTIAVDRVDITLEIEPMWKRP